MRILSHCLSDTCGETDAPMLKREHFEFKETAVTIITDDSFMSIAKDAIFDARAIIESKIMDDPFFGSTFDPYEASNEDHDLIKRMCNASRTANVGPMAAVAGAVATYAVEALVNAGSAHSIVENGGDVAMITDRDVTIGLFTGDPELNNVALNIPPTKGILGICSSSGKIGPSISFGSSDICTVISKNVILADAAATALGNLVKEDMRNATEHIGNLEGIDGCIVCRNGKMAMVGDIPELVERISPSNNITRIIY